MNDDELIEFERRLSDRSTRCAPPALRDTVLVGVERELRAARWDRRLMRAAAVLLFVGLGLNVAIGWQAGGLRGASHTRFVESTPRQSLVDTAVVVAEATDAGTGSRFARQLAAMSGYELTTDEAAAIDAAVRRAATHESTNGDKG